MEHFRRLSWFLVATVLVECGGEPAFERVGRAEGAILGGTVDTRDPAVVALTDAWGYFFCTGTIVDSIHVLTAAHCLTEGAPAYVFSCTDTNTSDPSSDPQCYVPVASAAWHPGYDGNSSTHDIGVLELAEPTSIVPKKLPAHSLHASAVGTEIRLVGFGEDDAKKSGVKRQAIATIDEIHPDVFLIWGTPNHCYGDSGGPGFWPAGSANEMLVGVTSAGVTEDCAGGGIDTMVGDNLDWLESVGIHVPESEPGSGGGQASGGATSSTTSGGAHPVDPGGGGGAGSDGSIDVPDDGEAAEPRSGEVPEGGASCAMRGRGPGGEGACILAPPIVAWVRRARRRRSGG